MTLIKSIGLLLLGFLLASWNAYASAEAMQYEIPWFIWQIRDVFLIGWTSWYIFIALTISFLVLCFLKPHKKLWNIILIIISFLCIYPILDSYVAKKTNNTSCKYMYYNPPPQIMKWISASYSSSDRDNLCMRNINYIQALLFLLAILHYTKYYLTFFKKNISDSKMIIDS